MPNHHIQSSHRNISKSSGTDLTKLFCAYCQIRGVNAVLTIPLVNSLVYFDSSYCVERLSAECPYSGGGGVLSLLVHGPAGSFTGVNLSS
jgi:hypothetical protein